MDPLTPAAASALTARHWGILGSAEALPSYLDQNFRIRSDVGDYMLKIAHPAWSREDLDLENHALLALAERAPQIAWPRVEFTAAGEHLLMLPVGGAMCHVRLLSFVAGATWAAAIAGLNDAERAGLHTSLGAALGHLARGLAGFTHPAAGRAHPWNLAHLPQLRDEISGLDDGALRARVTAHMDAFAASLPRWQRELPQAVVHNDANDHNLIVAEALRGGWQVRALIDFGDMCTSFRIAELAIACTYAMQHETDALACAQRIVRGYLAVAPLTPAELDALHAFIAARACQSVLMAVRARREQPDNAYTLVSQRGMQALLQTLAGIAPAALAGPFPESIHE